MWIENRRDRKGLLHQKKPQKGLMHSLHMGHNKPIGFSEHSKVAGVLSHVRHLIFINGRE